MEYFKKYSIREYRTFCASQNTKKNSDPEYYNKEIKRLDQRSEKNIIEEN